MVKRTNIARNVKYIFMCVYLKKKLIFKKHIFFISREMLISVKKLVFHSVSQPRQISFEEH
jgi:hypothetical protein